MSKYAHEREKSENKVGGGSAAASWSLQGLRRR